MNIFLNILKDKDKKTYNTYDEIKDDYDEFIENAIKYNEIGICIKDGRKIKKEINELIDLSKLYKLEDSQLLFYDGTELISKSVYLYKITIIEEVDGKRSKSKRSKSKSKRSKRSKRSKSKRRKSKRSKRRKSKK